MPPTETGGVPVQPPLSNHAIYRFRERWTWKQVRMFLAKRTAQRMRLEEASAGLLQALQRGFVLRRVRATAISEIHTSLWRAALGTCTHHLSGIKSAFVCCTHRNVFDCASVLRRVLLVVVVEVVVGVDIFAFSISHAFMTNPRLEWEIPGQIPLGL